MALLSRYDPPAFLADFASIPGQYEAWHRAVSSWFDAVVAHESKLIRTAPQYYNAATLDPGGIEVEQAIAWNAFPKTLLRAYGRERALQLADALWPIERFGTSPAGDPTDPSGLSGVVCRVQDEYCEWHVLRDPDSGQIRRLTFTSEPPEYWQALSGLVPGGDMPRIPAASFPGDLNLLVELYRELVSPEVRLEDLIAAADIEDASGSPLVAAGAYNLYNPWNTRRGIAHLNAPPNSLVAEILLGGDGSVLRADPDGRLLVEPDALIAYADYGGANRNSDPTIGGSVNALARLGAHVTLRNPVGLYMDHIDLSGWQAPDGGDVTDFVRVVRGTPGMIERLVVEAPPGRKLSLGDLTIAGQPIRYGGQVAECITVKLVGVARITASPAVQRPPLSFVSRGFLDPAHATSVTVVPRPQGAPPGTVEAFAGEGAANATTATGRGGRAIPQPVAAAPARRPRHRPSGRR